MIHKIKSFSLITAVYAILCFPLFYFVYKFGTPYLGMIDFFDYYKLYKDFDYHSADSPLNMRLAGSFIVYCISKLGIVYNTACNIDQYPIDKVVYFSATLFNFICVVLTSTTLYYYLRRIKSSILFSFTGGLLYLLGFGTIFFELMPLIDAFTILLFTLVLYSYGQKSWLLIVPLVIMIFQREYVFLAFGLIAAIDYLFQKDKYFLAVLLANIVCFIIYILFRKCVFETTRYAHHTSLEFMMDSLTQQRFPLLPFIRQTLMTLNLFIIYLAVIAYKMSKQIIYNRKLLVVILALFIQILLLTFLLSLGNNAGRYFYIMTPLVIMALCEEIRSFKLESSPFNE